MLLSDNLDQFSELPATGTKGKYKFEKDLTGLDLNTNRLLFFGAESEIEEVKIKSKLLSKYSKITWTTNLQDAHFYIIKKSLVDYIIDNNKFFSLKSEFVPFIIKKQFSSLKKSQSKEPSQPDSKKIRPRLFDYIKTDEF